MYGSYGDVLVGGSGRRIRFSLRLVVSCLVTPNFEYNFHVVRRTSTAKFLMDTARRAVRCAQEKIVVSGLSESNFFIILPQIKQSFYLKLKAARYRCKRSERDGEIH